MNIEFDPVVDALYVRLSAHKVVESEQVQPGIVLDFDEEGKVVGIEVLNASHREDTQAPFQAAA